MAISIISNPTAIAAQSSVNNAGSSLSKTLKSLSTGLRINSAADDASGLAVSEKLRAQISGLNKAAANAQDAISMLQTAESAMGSITSMVQRIRELAIQSGNPAYTSNDRAMLQLEVDQLKEEIDRVSSSSEFNTKKLLNGDAAALWSVSNGNVEAIIKGAAREGDYKISYLLDPGKNSVYKTNIMRIGKGGEISAEIENSGTNIIKIDNFQTVLSSMTAKLTIDPDTRTIAISNALLNSDKENESPVVAYDRGAAALADGTYNSYTIEVEALNDRGTNTEKGMIRFRVFNTKTGELSDWVENVEVTSAGAVVDASAIGTNLAGISQNIFVPGSQTFNTSWKKGSKFVIGAYSGGAIPTGGAKLRLYSDNAGYNPDGNRMATLAYITANVTNADTPVTHKIYTVFMDNNDNITYGSVDITFGPGNILTGSTTAALRGEGSVAGSNTKLSQIEQFTNADGRMVLDNTQEISIYAGNGNVAKVLIEGSDTIADLENKFKQAVIEQLEIGAGETTADAPTVNNNLVKYVDKEGVGDRAVAGTFVIQSAALGSDSNLTFAGDESVLNALGINQIQKAADSALTVSVEDVHTKTIIGEDTVTDGRLRNVIKGVDIYVNPSYAADISFDTDTNKMVFTSKPDAQTGYLHIKNNSTKAAIGANEGQTLDISIGRLDTKSMGVSNINVASFDDAQKAITKLDLVLEDISKTRATAGGQISRLEYTINNLNTARENMVAAESRIRDLDIAVASTNLASQSILMQSATAMLAQANKIPNYAMSLLS